MLGLARLFLVLGIVIMNVTETTQAAKPEEMPAKHKVRLETHVQIPMRDGVKLSADLIRPDADGKFPAVLEYIPYRKDDVSRGGYDAHYYFAERGFVGVRLDVRGTGSSEGVNTDEYMAVEQQDGVDAVEWLAKQPWCNGNVGMYGTSYGGFTCIQVAMHRPPHLKAIVPMYATDDRYTDDCHYTPGGNMRMYYDVGTYGGAMVAMNALPPSQELVGPKWAEMWKQRLEENQPYLLTWLKNQTDGPYWRVASLRPDYDRIKCPVFLIAGWRDGYANTMLRTYMKLKAPKKILVGPWVHSRPNVSVPGPRINYLHEVVRFFAEHLRGEDTGIMKELAVTVYMQEYAKPERTLDITPGHWRNLNYTIDTKSDTSFYVSEEGILATGSQSGGLRGSLLDAPRIDPPPFYEIDYIPTVGSRNGYWSAGGMSFYLADDQRADEGHSLVFTSTPFKKEVAILGWPEVRLHASSSAKVATFVAKLSDVAPDGSSALIVDGSLNGTRRKSLEKPEPITPGEIYKLSIPMNPTGWVIKAGHRLRLAISASDFPNLWPTPENARIRIYRDRERDLEVLLPVVKKSKLEPPEFLPPPKLPQIMKSYSEAPKQQVLVDQITGAVTVINAIKGTSVLPDNRGELISDHGFRCTANSKDPSQASIVGKHIYTLKREDGTYEINTESTIRATATTFHLTINLTVYRNGKVFFQKQWLASEPRKLL